MLTKDTLTKVGEYTDKFNDMTGQAIPCGSIYQSSGLEVHIKKHHPKIVGSIDLIPKIIASPDYIGKNPKEPNSIELVKRVSENLMVCIKLDTEKNYLYVATMFDLTESKLEKRINSGRLQLFR